MATIKVSRRELYDKIWTDSLAATAREYGMNGRVLKAVCTENNIPTPSTAYWSKLNYGKPVEKTPLPDPASDPAITITPDVDTPAEKTKPRTRNDQILDDFLSAKDRDRRIRDGLRKAREGRFTIDFTTDPVFWTKDIGRLTEIFPVTEGAHSTSDIILKTRQRQRILDLPYNRRDSVPYQVQPEEWLDIKTSKESFSRALAIFHSLIRILEALGCRIDSKEGNTTVKVNGFSVPLFITEKKNRIKADPSHYSTYDFVYSGILRVTVGRKFSYQNTVIEDTAHTKIEEKIDKIVIKVLESMMELQEWEEQKRKMEEERLRQQELERQRRLEAEKLKQDKEAERNRMRRLHARVRRHTLSQQYATIARHFTDMDENTLTDEQKAFARELEYFATLLDPTRPNPPDNLLSEKELSDIAIELLYDEDPD